MDEENELNKLFGNNIKIERSLSYSRLSDFDRNGPIALIKKSIVEGIGVKIGSITDDLALPKDGFVFEDNYIVSDYEKPTATLGALIDIILNNYTTIPSTERILEICKTNSFWKRSKDETITANFDTDAFWGYLKIHIQGHEKAIISTADKERAQNLVERLQESKNSSHIFKNEFENHNQFMIDFVYKGVRLRGILDKLIIDHKAKTVQMIDLKTGADNALMFLNSFIKYRYYLQEAVYTKAFNHICEQLQIKGYSMLPFQFLYIGRKERVPLIYTTSSKWHKAAVEGFNIKEYVYKGLDELIEDVKWHFTNNEFEMPRKIVENNGNIILNDNFIDLK